MNEEQIRCELCGEQICLNGRTVHGTIVSHRKTSCSKLIELRKTWTREKLFEEYVTKNRTALDISYEMGFMRGTNFIDDLLRKYDIPKKTCKQSSQVEKVLQKRIQTVREKYEVDNVMLVPEIVQICKKHKPPREIVGPKISAALKKHTLDEWKEIKRKASVTLFERYGIHNVMQREDVRQKASMTRRGFRPDQVEEWKSDKLTRSTPQDLYPELFHSRKFRVQILDEQGWKCGLCGIDRSKHKRFPLHHIDCDKSNNDRRNLIFLCSRCHGKVHGGINLFKMMKLVLQERNRNFVMKNDACAKGKKPIDEDDDGTTQEG